MALLTLAGHYLIRFIGTDNHQKHVSAQKALIKDQTKYLI